AGDGGVLVGRALDRVDHENGDIGLFDRPAGDHHADRLHLARARDAAGTADPRGVDDTEQALVPFQQRVDRIPRGPRQLADDRSLRLQQAVEQGRLADVGAADDGDTRFLLDDGGDVAAGFGEALDQL